jgi:hypothetical protein
MFARGLVSLHTPPLLGRKPSLVKSRVSISSKLIENKRFQVLYSGHLRKTGGRGSYRLVYTAYLPLRKPHGTKSHHSRTFVPSGLSRGIRATSPQVQSFPHLRDTWGEGGLVIPIRLGLLLVINIPRLTTSFSSFHSPLSLSSLQYPAPIAHPLPRTEPIRIPAISGSPPRGYVGLCL